MFITKIKIFLYKFYQKIELDLGSALIFIFTKYLTKCLPRTKVVSGNAVYWHG